MPDTLLGASGCQVSLCNCSCFSSQEWISAYMCVVALQCQTDVLALGKGCFVLPTEPLDQPVRVTRCSLSHPIVHGHVQNSTQDLVPMANGVIESFFHLEE